MIIPHHDHSNFMLFAIAAGLLTHLKLKKIYLDLNGCSTAQTLLKPGRYIGNRGWYIFTCAKSPLSFFAHHTMRRNAQYILSFRIRICAKWRKNHENPSSSFLTMVENIFEKQKVQRPKMRYHRLVKTL